MKKRRLKGYVIPLFSAIISSMLLFTIYIIDRNSYSINDSSSNFKYVSDSIIDNTIPVMNEIENQIIIRPYIADSINVYKKYYDGEENKENAIIYYRGTYIQNSGILYSSDNEFNVVSILDGEVIDIKDDDLLGKVVEIKHNNSIISTYEGLKDINVVVGDRVKQNTIIGTSGEITLDTTLKNALLFELTKDGKFINPDKCYDKTYTEL